VAVDLQSPLDLLGDLALKLDDCRSKLVHGCKAFGGHQVAAGGKENFRLEDEAVADDADVLAPGKQFAQAAEEIRAVAF